ncbi:NAD(P)-binding protein [Desulfoscipio gibsoniae]|uniref:NADPH-dependent glutamate synthase beta chain-like oxidoreductase n=1 Tax=Desulfoscipio gibsoniae DSM 7213 TaxID=767817 RepID=R4KLY1_9FIRM|nr:NAD(P)-binding protein [Desulfoscipio gibsoniae]AGL00651.1 NADPH-dependent glutamate synthase beta chain-like oxidoreductase [Desulfoscipio gibsoniae DSM 7213]
MPTETKKIPPVWTTGWTDIINTGTWRSVIPEHQQRPSPCQVACPLGGDIPVWLQQVREGQYYAAWLTLVANNPFPAVTGRVCHHPCEINCNRSEYDGSVTINALEQFIGDLALQEGWTLPAPAPGNGIRVAVIGSGPAGLSCAYQLRMRGFEVTVFEAQSEAGGVLRYGIPEYRLPKEIVSQEIQRLLAFGIKLQTNAIVDDNIIAQLEKEYATICIAIGAPKAKMLPQFATGDPRVLNGLQFLLHINQNSIPSLGQQVIVIGGGSVAMDVARSARRLGKQVQVLALEDKSVLPAQAEEVQEALEEGITIIDGAMVQETAEDNNRLILNCIKVVLDPAAPAGVLRPVVVSGTDFQIVADTVILAVGQDPDLDSFAKSFPIKNNLVDVDTNQSVGRAGIFACGDVSNSMRYVSMAIGAGKQAARGMEAFCTGRSANDSSAGVPPEPVLYKEINTFYFPKVSRKEKQVVVPELRVQDFREVKLAFSEEDVQIQAERCFSCGHCLKCDNCYYYCPDMAIIKVSTPEPSYGIADQYCKGCGLCVEECPRGAIILKEVKR